MFLSNINGTWDSSVLYRHYSLQRSWRCGRINKTWSMIEKQVDAEHQTWPLIPQFSSVAQSCPTLCDLINCSMPGLPVHHQLPEFTQIQVHWVGDAIQPSHLLSVPFSSHLQSFPGSESFPMSQFFASDQIRSVAQSCPTLLYPMNRSMPGLPVHHQLPEFSQTQVHRVSDVIQPSHPLSSPSPPAPNPSQHQSLFQWVNSSHEVAKVLEFQL